MVHLPPYPALVASAPVHRSGDNALIGGGGDDIPFSPDETTIILIKW